MSLNTSGILIVTLGTTCYGTKPCEHLYTIHYNDGKTLRLYDTADNILKMYEFSMSSFDRAHLYESLS
jgi:hypothetical protein